MMLFNEDSGTLRLLNPFFPEAANLSILRNASWTWSIAKSIPKMKSHLGINIDEVLETIGIQTAWKSSISMRG